MRNEEIRRRTRPTDMGYRNCKLKWRRAGHIPRKTFGEGRISGWAIHHELDIATRDTTSGYIEGLTKFADRRRMQKTLRPCCGHQRLRHARRPTMLQWVVALALLLVALSIASYIWKLKRIKGKSDCAQTYKKVPLVYEDLFRQSEKEPKPEDENDAVDEHLDKLSKQLGLTENEVRTTRCKIRETKDEMSNVEALDEETKNKYVQLINALREDLDSAEKESRLLQFRIEKIVQRRVALGDQVEQGRQRFRCAAARLAARIGELHRGRQLEPALLRDESSFTSLHRLTGPSRRQAHPTESLIKIWTNTNAFACSNDVNRANVRNFNNTLK
ncbi:hypothetical protein EVAR_3645_1 [Eumeta japonica]|uniref:Uncharacterized protein n=1 Tax=Eumeta variegata TaxID=151549 RepID=A0A4C1SYI6_EUMVA|nr:hypothetical protein EVAR_3645_1 [Eumeta japonica]